MATDTEDPTPGTREHFLRVTQLQRWGTIQEYVELCRARGYFLPRVCSLRWAVRKIPVSGCAKMTRGQGSFEADACPWHIPLGVG